AYTCGPGNINKALLRAGATEQSPKDFWDIYYFLPQETRGYLPGFIAANYAMTYYADHGISPALARRPIVTDTVHVHSRIALDHVSSVLNLPIEELRLLNPQYRKGIIPGDIRPYALRLPAQLIYAYLLSEDSISALAKSSPSRRPLVEIGARQAGSVESVKWHNVGRGETLSKIATKYGVSIDNLKRWNNLKSTKLKRGQKLKIITYVPAPDSALATADTVSSMVDLTVSSENGSVNTAVVEKKPQPKKASSGTTSNVSSTVTHTVRKGDTLWKISQKYGTTVDKILKTNGLNKNVKLQIGQKIKIPKR
ncbi:MAG: LysM peptidoglycan-binding domain-containing protein, partial [Muribaculaceae bacterium]|nr:LysM peptidoglycan-binding domain-containing protein [Muribaculaceae bacterium]